MNNDRDFVEGLLVSFILAMILGLILSGCGVKVQPEGSNHTVQTTVAIEYAEIAEFCDARYGYKSEEAEDCFLDYRNFFDTEASFDTTSLVEFCQAMENPSKCLGDLSNLISKGSEK